jgi:hypothetical protein
MLADNGIDRGIYRRSRLRVNRPRAKRWSADRLLVSGHPIIGGTALLCIIIQV